MMENVFRHLHMPPSLACQFLAIFSRMEYALKSTQYAIGNDSKIDPWWDRFANDIDAKFLGISTTEVIEARDYLLDHPPRKQTFKNEQITFVDQIINTSQTKTQQLLLMVRTIRNNLFHGGKYSPKGEHEAGRDCLLVQHSLTVLLACSRLDPTVQDSFEK